MQRPISKVLLEGLYDKECVLSHLRGCQHVMRRIWEELLDYWTQAIRLPVKDFVDENAENLGVPMLKLADEERPQPQNRGSFILHVVIQYTKRKLGRQMRTSYQVRPKWFMAAWGMQSYHPSGPQKFVFLL